MTMSIVDAARISSSRAQRAVLWVTVVILSHNNAGTELFVYAHIVCGD